MLLIFSDPRISHILTAFGNYKAWLNQTKKMYFFVNIAIHKSQSHTENITFCVASMNKGLRWIRKIKN